MDNKCIKMDRKEYFKNMGWNRSPFIKSTSYDIPIIARVEEYSEVCEAIGGWDRIMAITAPIGHGKTTFMNQLIMQKPDGIEYIVGFNAYENIEGVMKRIMDALPIYKRIFIDKSDKTGFGESLQKKIGSSRILLIFDEAQDYEYELFRWLRILNDRANNVFMIFLGLSGLEDKIVSEASFRDRKSKSIRLRPFPFEDLEELINKRIEWAGGKPPRPFTKKGLSRLCESCNHVPRRLLENAQKTVLEACKEGIYDIDEEFVERVLGYSEDIATDQQADDKDIVSRDYGMLSDGTYYDFMGDLSPTQQDIVCHLRTHESLSVSELSQMLKKDIRSIGSLIRKLRGLNKNEVKRKPNVPYPVIIRNGKETRCGRLQYVYSLSDNARRMLAKA